MRMNKKTRKIIIRIAIAVVAIVFVIMMSGAIGGCPRRDLQGRILEVDGWTLFQFNRSRQPHSRNVNIISNPSDAVVDGVLTIPERIGRHDINSFLGGLVLMISPLAQKYIK